MDDTTTTTTTADAPDQSTPPGDAADKTGDSSAGLESVKAELEKLRSDHKAALGRLSKIDKERQAAEAARLAEEGKFKELAERAKAEAEAAKAELLTAKKRNAAMEALTQAGVKTTALPHALKLVTDSIEVGEDGNVTNALDVAKKLSGELPELFGVGANGTGAPAGVPVAPNGAGQITLADMKADPKKFDEALAAKAAELLKG